MLKTFKEVSGANLRRFLNILRDLDARPRFSHILQAYGNNYVRTYFPGYI